uniref:Dynein heavy chain 1, axonemal n=1 Tax=Rhabditophanes sp. KR3021 TaxID=114890 RepID=A0AC35U4U6_9BILA
MEEEDIDVIIDDLQIIVDVDADINVDVVEEDNHVVIEKEHVLRLEEVSVVVEPNADPILVSDPEIVAGITLLTLSSGATEETVVVPENLLVNTVNQYEEIKKDLIAGSNAETIMTPLVKGAMEINSWPIGDRKMGFIEPPFFLDLEEQSEYGELNERLIIKFVTNYLNHCQEMLDTIKQLNFNNVYDTLVSFWQNEIEDDLPEPMENQDLTIPAEEDVQVVVEPSVHATSILNKICSIPEIQKYMICVDLEFYQSVLETLIPNVLRGEMNQTITALFDLFGKKIVDDLSALLIDFDVTFKANKLNTARLFSQTLDRYVSINRLVYALRTVTENSASVEQMYTDFCSLDMEVIHARANFVCGSDSTIVTNIEHSFESGLKNNKSVEDWSEWIEAVIDQSMASCHDKSFKESVEHAKQFILKWTYHTTMILRKLMLNMAASYASFDLLKSFFDEIVPHMLEQKLAKIKNVPSISINLCNQSDSYYYVEHFKFKTSANDEKGTLKKRIYRKRAASALSKEKKATVSKGINKKKPSKLNNIENNKNINANKAV